MCSLFHGWHGPWQAGGVRHPWEREKTPFCSNCVNGSGRATPSDAACCDRGHAGIYMPCPLDEACEQSSSPNVACEGPRAGHDDAEVAPRGGQRRTSALPHPLQVRNPLHAPDGCLFSPLCGFRNTAASSLCPAACLQSPTPAAGGIAGLPRLRGTWHVTKGGSGCGMCSAAVVGDRWIIHGGRRPGKFNVTNQTYIFDFSTLRCARLCCPQNLQASSAAQDKSATCLSAGSCVACGVQLRALTCSAGSPCECCVHTREAAAVTPSSAGAQVVGADGGG